MDKGSDETLFDSVGGILDHISQAARDEIWELFQTAGEANEDEKFDGRRVMEFALGSMRRMEPEQLDDLFGEAGAAR